VVVAFVAGCGGGRTAPADAGASAGAGSPRGLLAGGAQGIALAGDVALVAREGGTESSPQAGLSVIGVPLTGSGGAPATVAWPNRPTGLSVLSMDGSPALVALTATPADDEESGWVSGLFGGPATGPVDELEPVRAAAPGVRIPRSVQVDGSHQFVAESDGEDAGDGQFTARTAGEPDRSVDLPPGAESVTFAGDLVAYAQDPPRSTAPPPRTGQRDLDAGFPHHVFIRDWRTGEQRTALSVRRGVAGLALSHSGALAVGEYHGGVVELRPGRPLRRIARSQPAPWPGAAPVYAGERLVLVRRRRTFGPERLVVSEPGGRTRAFGVPSLAIGVLAADERRVAWSTRQSADGCIVVADLVAPAARTIAAGGPCTRTTISLGLRDPTGQRSELRPGGRVGVALECVAAPPSGCRGVLRVMDGARAAAAAVRFAVAPGRTRRLVARLTPAARALVLARRSAAFTVTTSAVDPDGRGSEQRGELIVDR
jgi:hypothetical protein